MKNTKRRLIMFAFYDRSGIQRFLEDQAEKGWMLEKTSAFGWKFRRIEPKRIHFTVTYFPDASSFDPEPSEKQLMFQEFCEHTGWVLAASNAQMQIFYNEAEDPVPIETDALLEVENVHAAVKKSFLPAYFMNLGLGVMQLGLFFYRLHIDPVGTLSQNANLFALACWLMTLLTCGVELGRYYGWRRKAKRAAEIDGSFVENKGTTNLQVFILCFTFAALALMMYSLGDSRLVSVALLTVAGILAITAVIVAFTALMKRLKVSTKVNRVVTLTLTVVLSLVFTGVLIFSVVENVMRGSGQEEQYETYEYKGHSYRIHRDEIPLTIEDLMETDYDEYNYTTLLEDESILLRRYAASQDPRWDAMEEPEMDYSIVDVKMGFLYDLCLNDMLTRYDGNYSEDINGNIYHDSYVKVDASAWGAETVYQLRQGGTSDMSQRYILCYADRLVELDLDWEITPEQMAIVGEVLGK